MRAIWGSWSLSLPDPHQEEESSQVPFSPLQVVCSVEHVEAVVHYLKTIRLDPWGYPNAPTEIIFTP